MRAAIACLGCKPTRRSTNCPRLKINRVGMASILYCDAMRGFSSVFNLATTYLPADSVASWSMIGATIRQGPHQGAQASTSTGRSAFMTADAKVASVTVRGLLSAVAALERGRGGLQLAQTGWRLWARRSSTRFFAPQLGQVMMDMGAPVHLIRGCVGGGGDWQSVKHR